MSGLPKVECCQPLLDRQIASIECAATAAGAPATPPTTNPRNKLMTEEITNTTSTAAIRRPSHCLTEAEVSCIRTGVEAAPGSWFAVDLDCACCGNTTVAIGPTCDAVPGPWFEVSRDEDRRIILTTTWLDGEDYTSEFWSVSVALSAIISTIATATAEMELAV